MKKSKKNTRRGIWSMESFIRRKSTCRTVQFAVDPL